MLHTGYKSALVTESTVTAYTNVSGNSLSKHFNAKNIANDLLCFPLNVRMDKGDVVVTCNDIA
jgi:hypothetical protein